MSENYSSAIFPDLGRQSKPLVPVLVCLVLIACAIGIGTVVLFETKDPKWGTYTFLCMLLAGLILGTGNLRHALFFLAALTVPLNVDFRFFARDRDVGGPSGLFLSGPDVCALLLLMLLLLVVLARQRELLRWCPRTTIPWLLLLGAATLSMPFSYDKTMTVYRGILLVQHMILYFVFANLLTTETDVRWALRYLVVALVLGSGLYLVSSFTGADFNLVTGEERSLATIEEYGGVVRASGTFGHPIQAGQYFVAAIWIPLALLCVSRHVLAPTLLYGIFAMGSVCTAYTLSRAAYISYICGLICYLYYGLRFRLIKISTAVASGMVVCILCLPVSGLVWARLTLDDHGAGESRKPLNKQAIYMASKNPVLGVGAGTYSMAMGDYRPPGLKIPWEHYVHNEYLMWWAECGTPGLLALLVFLGSAVLEARRTLKSRSPVLRAAGFAFLCMLAAWIPNMWFDTGLIGLAAPASRLLAITLGIIAATRIIEKTHENGFDR